MKRIMIWSMLLVDWAQRRFTGRGDVGASLVEYALLLALIAVVAIGAIAFLGHSVNNQLNNVAQVINTNTTGRNERRSRHAGAVQGGRHHGVPAQRRPVGSATGDVSHLECVEATRRTVPGEMP